MPFLVTIVTGFPRFKGIREELLQKFYGGGGVVGAGQISIDFRKGIHALEMAEFLYIEFTVPQPLL